VKRIYTWLTDTPEKRVALALTALFALLYIPFAGNYGMWDPWETHYGEVARQMAERRDWISLWWPGSPQDRTEFWSKPVLTFWILALSMRLAGLESAHPDPGEIARSWRVEWATRVPMILLSIAALISIYALVRRMAGRRAAALATVVLGTAGQWVLVTRQVMTDMPFVAPMTIALALGGLALLMPEDEREAAVPRRAFHLGSREVSWPHTPAFYVFVALFALTTLPQIIMMSIDLRFSIHLGTANYHFIGLVAMLPYLAAFLVALFWCARATNKRQLYLFSAWLLCAIASLAKGPAGLALPAIVLAVWLILAGRWKDIFTKMEIFRGPVIFIATAFPWYHAMLIRHGAGFWMEFIGDNYVHRAAGRHGDRGTWEYYVQWTAYGMFPWTGVSAAASLLSFKRLRDGDTRRGLYGFAVVWLVGEFTVMTLVNTKFHHYILPALPALAILTGLFLDELFEKPERLHVLLLALIGAPLTFFCGRDLASFPPRLLWLFNYDYVNMPGSGRPWPTVAMYGQRYEYGHELWLFAGLATGATVALALYAWLAYRKRAPDAPPAADPDARPVASNLIAACAVGFLALIVGAILLGPKSPGGEAPVIRWWWWMLPTALILPGAALVGWLVYRVPSRTRNWAVAALGALGVLWSCWLADKMLIELSPHWSQKHVLAQYFRYRTGPEEPLIAWQLYWRGENFYTRNEIYKSPNAAERTVFLGDHNAEKMQQYFTAHPGRRIFFVVERVRFESLRSMLPASARSSLQILDESNNKIYLAAAQL
jgi:4-amino-4-deoxy-L-arabinose transferase-like glycosyltransferase